MYWLSNMNIIIKIRKGPLDLGFKLGLEGLQLCRAKDIADYIHVLTDDTTFGQPGPIIVVAMYAINMR